MRSIVALLCLSGLLASEARADEGMWLFSNLPLKRLKDSHGFEPPPGWAEHLRSAAVRFNNGGSGSFISPDGLIMTNHHVGADTLAKISNSTKDYYKDGFLARSHGDEVKAPDLELNALVGIRDVTTEVLGEVKAGMSDVDAGAAKRKAMARLEKEATDRNGLRNDVVTLYQGGRYHLYTYKTYTDVRLVFAPEFAIAFFGGDPDNFEYPRYDLDVCFFRAYENGKPARVQHWLKWSAAGARDGELVFVAGHPGRTDRLNTIASLEFLRDLGLPFQLGYLKDREAFLLEYARKGAEEARQAQEELFGYQNSRKARVGGLAGLQTRSFMERKAAAETELRDWVKANSSSVSADTLMAWDRIAEAQKTAAKNLKAQATYERAHAFESTYFRIARILVRLADESAKPNAERLEEYRDSARKSLELRLFSPAPIYPGFEEARLAHSLADWKKVMPEDPLIEKVLAGRTPAEAARAMVAATRLADPRERRQIAAGGKKAIEESRDPFIKLALLTDPAARAARKIEDEIEGIEAANYALIARALFARSGDSVYPDATFTLRLAYGIVKGYAQNGKAIPPFTNIAGAFEHASVHGDEPPYRLPESWVKAKDHGGLKLATPLNFVSTADIIGGNSGSPVVNRANEVVGLIFDGNIQSLVLDFGFDEEQARAVSVDSRALIEALRSVYHADTLVGEILGESSH